MLEFKIIQCPEKNQLGMYRHFEDEISIGNADADMIVDDPNMAPCHARFFCKNSNGMVENTSDEFDIKINVKIVKPGESMAFSTRDNIVLGKTVFQFSKIQPGPPAFPAEYRPPQHDARFAEGTKESAILKSLDILSAAKSVVTPPPPPRITAKPPPPPLPKGK